MGAIWDFFLELFLPDLAGYILLFISTISHYFSISVPEWYSQKLGSAQAGPWFQIKISAAHSESLLANLNHPSGDIADSSRFLNRSMICMSSLHR